MIWGMTLHPGVEYTREVMSKEYFTLASLDCRARMMKEESNPVAHVLMKSDNRETVLCTLEKGVVNQQGLNFLLQAGDHLTLSVEGTGIVYISGYTVSCPQISDDICNDRSTSSPLVRCMTEPDGIAENFTPDHPTYTCTEGNLPSIVEGSVTHIETDSMESVAMDKIQENVTNQELSELEDEVMARTEGSVTHIMTELVESDAIDDNENDKNVTNQGPRELEDEVMVRSEDSSVSIKLEQPNPASVMEEDDRKSTVYQRDEEITDPTGVTLSLGDGGSFHLQRRQVEEKSCLSELSIDDAYTTTKRTDELERQEKDEESEERTVTIDGGLEKSWNFVNRQKSWKSHGIL